MVAKRVARTFAALTVLVTMGNWYVGNLCADQAQIIQQSPTESGRIIVSLAVTLPSGAKPVLSTTDGGVVSVFVNELGTFSFRPTIRDAASGAVRLTIFGGSVADNVILGELDLIAGGPAIPTNTTPAFEIAVSIGRRQQPRGSAIVTDANGQSIQVTGEVTFQMNQVPTSDVLAYLARASGIEIRVATGTDLTAPMTLTARNAKTSDMLRFVLDSAHLTFKVLGANTMEVSSR